MEDSDKQSIELWTVLQDYLKYIKHDRTRVSLEDYVVTSKAHRDSFVGAILHGGARVSYDCHRPTVRTM